MDRIILASGSEQRRASFALLGLDFAVIPADIDETPPPGLAPEALVLHLARRKAEAVVSKAVPTGAGLVFAADTVIALEGKVFCKPADRRDARRMLEALSGRTHEAVTGMALLNLRSGEILLGGGTARVEFSPLSDGELEWYLDSGEWEGAAGAYRLQGRGAALVRRIEGTPGAVTGLPLPEFYAMLRQQGFRFGA
ncbi:MAG: Maf family protein [Treponema sp.]|nr:Maf family protein [Treponema sp.]